jgi:hypothetical protein
MCFMENKLDETGMKWKEHAWSTDEDTDKKQNCSCA